MDVVEEYFGGKIAFRVRGLQARESLWVHSNGVNGKPTFHMRSQLSWLSKMCNHFGEIYSGIGNRWLWSSTNWGFFGNKDPLRANFHKCFPKLHMRTRKHVFLCKFREIWRSSMELSKSKVT